MGVCRTDLGSSEYVSSPAEKDVHYGRVTLLASEVKRRQTILPQKKHAASTNKAVIDRRLRPRCCHLGSYVISTRK